MVIVEFMLERPPLSIRASSKNRYDWREYIEQQVKAKLSPRYQPTEHEVCAYILYFYKDSPALDTDNMVKPILDSLNRLVYVDDRQVSDVIARRRSIYGDFSIPSLPSLIARKLQDDSDFVYVRITQSIEDGELF